VSAARETGGMKPPPDPHYRHRFPTEIISHTVWLYHVFSLSLRDVELLLAERGIVALVHLHLRSPMISNGYSKPQLYKRVRFQ
jgi:transposase-like protein